MAENRRPLIAALGVQAAARDTNPAVEQVLDAALAQFEDIGIRRSTIEDIARRAGIDRVTVYRRVGSKDDVIQAVIAREVRRLIDEVAAASAPLPTLEERVAAGFKTVVQRVRQNALYNRALALDAEAVLPRVTTHAGAILAIGVDAAAGLIHQAQADGILGAVADPQAVAEVLVRIVHSFVLSPQLVVSLQSEAELEAFARSHLARIVTG